MFCENCGSEISENWKFCQECGHKNPRFKFVTEANPVEESGESDRLYENSDTLRYSTCHNCGKKISYGRTLCRKCSNAQRKQKRIKSIIIAVVGVAVLMLDTIVAITLINKNKNNTTSKSENLSSTITNDTGFTWSFDNYTLTLSGQGQMDNYCYKEERPWEGSSQNIKRIVISEGITSIGDYSFCDCTSLETVSIPSSVETIGDSAFENCMSLTELTILPDSVKTIGRFAFSNCRALSSVTLPDDITTIGEYAFSFCTDLSAIEIPNGLSEIGSGTFSYCTNLNSVTIPDGVTTIYSYAFRKCDSLTEVSIPNKNYSTLAFDLNTDVMVRDKNAEIQSTKSDTTSNADIEWTLTDAGLTLTISGTGPMDNYTYTNVAPWGGIASSVEKVIILDGITRIGSHAFDDFVLLKNVSIPTTVTRIESSAFSGCESLNSITIPSSVKYIGGFCFSSCKELETVELEGVVEIGSYAFSDCIKLKSVSLPEGVKVIEEGDFANCESLSSITIPEGVIVMEEAVFSGCAKLASVSLPKTLQGIEKEAFTDCPNLKNAHIPNEDASIDSKAFDSTASYTVGSSSTPVSGAPIISVNRNSQSDVVSPEVYIDTEPVSSHTRAYIYGERVKGWTVDMSVLFPCYENLDIDGDGITDVLYREEKQEKSKYTEDAYLTRGYYSFLLGSGRTLSIAWDADNIDTRHELIFSFCDMNGDGVKECLLENYECGTAGYTCTPQLIYHDGSEWNEGEIPLPETNITYDHTNHELHIRIEKKGINQTIPYECDAFVDEDLTSDTPNIIYQAKFTGDHTLVILVDVGIYKCGDKWTQLYGYEYSYDGSDFTLISAGTDVAEKYWPEYYASANSLWGTWYDSDLIDE